MAQLRQGHEQIKKSGGQIIVVDPHEVYRVRHMLKGGKTGFPILADPAYTVSATYGVAFQMRIHTEWSNRPATVIIDKEGIIRYERRATTFADRPNVARIVQVLNSLK